MQDITASYDFVANRSNPSPQTSDYHGTSCAGIIAMERNNYYCGAGVAYNCRIGGIVPCIICLEHNFNPYCTESSAGRYIGLYEYIAISMY